MPAAQPLILVLNCGSSSVKFALFCGTKHECVGKGSISGVGGTSIKFSASGELFPSAPPQPSDCRNVSDAIRCLVEWLEKALPANAIRAVGHRVVHGGDFSGHVAITQDVVSKLKTFIPLAPLHQPFNLEAIEIMSSLHPDVPQAACFDTAFHSTIPPLHTRFALPRVWHDKGVRRYGFHGLSYEYIAGKLRSLSPSAHAGRVLVAHLGSGASLCAMKAGVSFDTSLGFSTLDGLIMGTRCGTLDAGVVLYFMRECKMELQAIEKLLYKESGLMGISGISADMAALLSDPSPHAKEAVDMFCLRVTREASALIGLMGGVDAFVFTGGIGENSEVIRSRIMESIGWAELALDEASNISASNKEPRLLSPVGMKTEVWMIPTDEEAVIARHATKIAG